MESEQVENRALAVKFGEAFASEDYDMVPRRLRLVTASRGMSLIEQALVVVLLNLPKQHTDGAVVVFCSYTEVARRLGVHVDTARDLMRSWKKKGIIRVVEEGRPGRGFATRYDVAPLQALLAEALAQLPPSGKASAPGDEEPLLEAPVKPQSVPAPRPVPVKAAPIPAPRPQPAAKAPAVVQPAPTEVCTDAELQELLEEEEYPRALSSKSLAMFRDAVKKNIRTREDYERFADAFRAYRAEKIASGTDKVLWPSRFVLNDRGEEPWRDYAWKPKTKAREVSTGPSLVESSIPWMYDPSMWPDDQRREWISVRLAEVPAEQHDRWWTDNPSLTPYR